MINSDSFELRESNAVTLSFVLFLRRFSKIEMNKTDYEMNKSLLISLNSKKEIS